MPEEDGRGHTYYTSHGTHVSGIIASLAPDIDLYVYRVMHEYGSGDSNVIMQGIETAYQSGADIMNLSLGSDYGDPYDPECYALNVATLAGTVVCVSVGNSGNNGSFDLGAKEAFTAGAPGVASLAVTVGAAQRGGVGYENYPAARTNKGAFELALLGYDEAFTLGDDLINGGVPLTKNASGAYLYVDLGDGSQSSYGDLTGKIAVVQRGTTNFVDMRDRAVAAGAGALIVINKAVDGDGGVPLTGGVSISGMRPENVIPIFSVTYNDGKKLTGGNGALTLGTYSPDKPLDDILSDFSSWGPVSSTYHIKPDVVAPGTNIMSAVPNYITNPNHSNVGGYDKAYATDSGTSMASPEVAGIAALMVQYLPSASPTEIKARLMNTAEPLGKGYSVYQIGAGFINPIKAMTATDYATVTEDIPWLIEWYPGWSAGISYGYYNEGTEPHDLSSLNLGVVTKDVDETRSIEFQTAGWTLKTADPLFDVNISGTTATVTTKTATIAAVNRVYEGNLVFVKGGETIRFPYAFFLSDGKPFIWQRGDGGFYRPVITTRNDEWVDNPEYDGSWNALYSGSSNFATVALGFNDPTGASLPVEFYAESVDGGKMYYYGKENSVPSNKTWDFPMAAAYEGVNVSTGTSEKLPEGVYNFIFAVYEDGYTDGDEPINAFSAGKFVVSDTIPELFFDNAVGVDRNGAYIFEYDTETGAIGVEGHVYSYAHEMCAEYDIHTILYEGDPVFGYDFAIVAFEEFYDFYGYADEDGTFSFTLTAPYVSDDGYLTFAYNYAIDACSPDILAGGSLSYTYGNLYSEDKLIAYTSRPNLMAAAWKNDGLSVTFDKTPSDVNLYTDLAFGYSYGVDGDVIDLDNPGKSEKIDDFTHRFTFPEFGAGDTVADSVITSVTPPIDAPVAAAVKEYTVSSESYEGKITWNGTGLLFNFGTVYAASVEIYAADGRVFSPNLTVMAPPAQISGLTISADGLKATFTATFPKTETIAAGNALVVLNFKDSYSGNTGWINGLFLDGVGGMTQAFMNAFDPNFGGVHNADKTRVLGHADYGVPESLIGDSISGGALGYYAAMIPAGLYDYLLTQVDAAGLFPYSFGSTVFEKDRAYVFTVDWDYGADDLVLDFDDMPIADFEYLVDSASAAPSLVDKNGGNVTVHFTGVMPSDTVGLFNGAAKVGEFTATGSMSDKTATVTLPANNTAADVTYIIKISDGKGGWLDTAATVTVSHLGSATVILESNQLQGDEYLFQMWYGLNGDTGGGWSYEDYAFHAPDSSYADRYTVGVETGNDQSFSIPAGCYDLMFAYAYSYYSYYNGETYYYFDTGSRVEGFTFEEGVTYKFATPAEYYNTLYNIKTYINGKEALKGNVTVNLTAPVGGATPVTSFAGEGYTGAATWGGSPATFDYETAYTAHVTLTASSVTFAAVTNFLIEGATITNIVNNGSTVTFDAVFSETDPEPLPGKAMIKLVLPLSMYNISDADYYGIDGYTLRLDKNQGFPSSSDWYYPPYDSRYDSAYSLPYTDEMTDVRLGNKGVIFVDPGTYDMVLLARNNGGWVTAYDGYQWGEPFYALSRGNSTYGDNVFEADHLYTFTMPSLGYFPYSGPTDTNLLSATISGASVGLLGVELSAASIGGADVKSAKVAASDTPVTRKPSVSAPVNLLSTPIGGEYRHENYDVVFYVTYWGKTLVTAFDVPVTGVRLDRSALNMYTRESVTLTATVLPVAAADRGVIWYSSDESVAVVDQNGKVTAIRPGTAVISAETESGGFIAECVVTVTNAPKQPNEDASPRPSATPRPVPTEKPAAAPTETATESSTETSDNINNGVWTVDLPDGATVEASPTTDKLVVEDKVYESFPAIKIFDFNFVKLRDLAFILNGLPAQFSVDYDKESNAVVIWTGKPYDTADGHELEALRRDVKDAVVSRQRIFIDGKEVKLTAFNVGGYNYFRLRDLAKYLGFTVDYTSDNEVVIKFKKK